MNEPIIVAGPLLIAAIIMAVRFVGCSLDEGGLESPQPYSTAVLATPNLVSFWRLNETSGTKAADSSDGNGGTYQNVSGVKLGVAQLANTDTNNTAAKFDGGTGSPSAGGGQVSVPFAANLNPAASKPFTVEALVNPTMIGNGDVNDYHAVVSSRNIAGGDSYGYILYLHGTNFEAWVGNGTPTWSSAVVDAGAAVDAGPYYLTMTYDGTTLKLYVNPTGTEAELATNPEEFAQLAVTYLPNPANELRIGAGENENTNAVTANYCFPGVIQDVAFYDAAVDFTTVQAHFAIAMTGFST